MQLYESEEKVTEVMNLLWTMRNATVRQILDRIVSQHNNGAWVVQQAPRNMDKEPSYGLWRLVEYDGNNGARFSALLQVWGLGLRSGITRAPCTTHRIKAASTGAERLPG